MKKTLILVISYLVGIGLLAMNNLALMSIGMVLAIFSLYHLSREKK